MECERIIYGNLDLMNLIVAFDIWPPDLMKRSVDAVGIKFGFNCPILKNKLG
jgi:hypothetical protein